MLSLANVVCLALARLKEVTSLLPDRYRRWYLCLSEFFVGRPPDLGTTLNIDNPGDASTRVMQPECGRKKDICHALASAAFTSSCQAKLDSPCLGPPGHHCLQPPHGVEDHCVFHALAFRCHQKIFVMLEAGTCAGSRACNFSTSPTSLRHFRISVLYFRCLHVLLPSSCVR